MRVVFFVPPLRRPSGGLTNIYETALNLSALGASVALKGPAADAPGLSEARGRGLALLPWEAPLEASDVWCIPEGWPNALPVGQKAGARTLVYVQNWVHMLDTLPQGVTWQQLPLDYIAVSRPIAGFLERIVGVKALGVVPPVVDAPFYQNAEKAPASDRVRVAWMPRKNKALGEQARRVCEMRLALEPGAPALDWVTIDRVPKAEVARLLAGCHIFLSTGFPEGFALPPAEAMASGCVVVGCTGFGGWEYMRQASMNGYSLPHAPPPDFPRSGDALPGNGFYTPDGDSLAAGTALARAVLLAAQGGATWQSLLGNARDTAERYNGEAQRQALAGLLRNAFFQGIA